MLRLTEKQVREAHEVGELLLAWHYADNEDVFFQDCVAFFDNDEEKAREAISNLFRMSILGIIKDETSSKDETYFYLPHFEAEAEND